MTSIHPRFAPVAPPQILQAMLEYDYALFGGYHLWLAHLTTQREREFTELLTHYYSRRYFASLTIIMDNSIVELGGAVDDDMIREASQIITSISDDCLNSCQVIPVLPDVMGDGKGTIALSDDAYERWVTENQMPCKQGVMLVTQGDCWGDFTDLVDHYFVHNKEKYSRITWVGIPRKLVGALGTRAAAVQYIKMVAPQVNMHLLGFSANIFDDVHCAKLGVRGIDSAVPVRYNHLLSPKTSEDMIGPRAHDWMDEGKLIYENRLNVYNVRRWIGQQDF